MLRGALVLLPCVMLVACGGSTKSIPQDDLATGGSAGSVGVGGTDASGGMGATGGTFVTGGTGGQPDEPDYMETPCPDEPPPPLEPDCDPLDPFAACDEGEGCYPYVLHPFGKECGYQQFGAACAPAGSGIQGDFCGPADASCAPGYLCVVGAGAGSRCTKLCPLEGPHGCPAGLICGETDIDGFGACF